MTYYKHPNPASLIASYYETLDDITAHEKNLPPDFTARMARNVRETGLSNTPRIIHNKNAPLVEHDRKNKIVTINSCFHHADPIVTKFVIAHTLADIQASRGLTIPMIKTAAITSASLLGMKAATAAQEPLLLSSCAVLGGALATLFMSSLQERHMKNDLFALNLYPHIDLDTVEQVWHKQAQEFKKQKPIIAAFNTMLPDILQEKVSIKKRIENMKHDQHYLIN